MELIITTFLYTYCSSSPIKKGFVIGVVEVCNWSLLGGIVLLDDLHLSCHSLVLGVGADITSYYFLLTGVADGTRGFQDAPSLLTQLFLISN